MQTLLKMRQHMVQKRMRKLPPELCKAFLDQPTCQDAAIQYFLALHAAGFLLPTGIDSKGEAGYRLSHRFRHQVSQRKHYSIHASN